MAPVKPSPLRPLFLRRQCLYGRYAARCIFLGFVITCLLACGSVQKDSNNIPIEYDQVSKKQHQELKKEQESKLSTLSIPSLSISNSPGNKEKSRTKTLTDSLEFIHYTQFGEVTIIKGMRGLRPIIFQYNWDLYNAELNRGDRIKVQWEADTLLVFQEGQPATGTHAILSIKKIADGPVSLFKKKFPLPIPYRYDEEIPYSSTMLNDTYKLVEFYLANTKQPRIEKALQNPPGISFSIESIMVHQRQYILIQISNTDDQEPLQWLCLDPATNAIFEFDPKNETFSKFSD